ncbi:MAG: 50S ribosomal protein L13 [bacterium]
MATYSAKPSDLEDQWYLVDAEGQILGRLASRIAALLRGKHLTTFTPHANMRTFVVVVNAEKVVLTGDKWDTKEYIHHTNHPGGLRVTTARKINVKKPGELIRYAVQGMLPHNRLGRATMTRLRVFAGPNHTHTAQGPKKVPLKTRQARIEQ